MISVDKFRYDIQALRAVAVLAVVVFHVNSAWLPGGFLGVDIFFVISGFVISRKIWGDMNAGIFSLRDFYIRRIKRLLPALFVTVAVTLFIGLIILPAEAVSELLYSAGAALLSLSNFFFWGQSGYFAPEALERPLLHTWSLGLEEQFYLIFPLIFIGLFKLKPRGRLLGLAGLILLSAGASQWVLRTDPNTAFYMLPFRGFEFLLGALTAAIPVLRGKASALYSALGVASLLFIITMLFVWNAQTPLPGWRAFIICLVTAFLLLIAPFMIGFAGFISSKPLQYIGNISYSLYLVHWPVIVFLNVQLAGMHVFIIAFIGLGMSLAAAALLYHNVEKPYRYRAFKDGLRGPILTSVLLCTCMGITAQALSNRGSVPQSNVTALGESIVLLGDSNADMYRGEILRQLTGNTGQFWTETSPGCPPLLTIRKTYERKNSERNRILCDQLMEKWEQDIAAHPAQTVILSARWEFYAALPVEGRISPRQDKLYRAGDVPVSTPEQTRKFLFKGLDAMILRLTKAGKRVVVIGQMPSQTSEAVRCARQNADLSPNRLGRKCATSNRADIMSQYREIHRTLRRLQNKYKPNVIYINPVDIFCQAEFCEMARDGRALYRDAHHFNTYGAHAIIRELSAVLATQ